MSHPLDLEPAEFECFIKEHLESLAAKLKDFRVEHLEKLNGPDGDYVIDVIARFEALGVSFLVLVECKRYKSIPIERELVQVLNQKKQSVAAHKAIMYTTSDYRDGAIEFARAHGIALVRIEYDQMNYAVKAWVGELKARLVSPEVGTLDRYLLGT
jgi:restriction system protein